MHTQGNLFKLFSILAIFSVFLLLASCNRSCPLSANSDKVIAYVNKEPVFASDLKRSMALKAKQDPLMITSRDIEQEQLEMMIERKLIIQEALRLGLANQDSFVQTIKSFWEQMLIREFLTFKKREFQNYLYVTNAEIKKYYDNLGKWVTFKVLKSTDKKQIEDIYNEIRQNKDADTSSWDTVGPVGYEDITSNVLYEAFELPEGQTRIIVEAPYYYLVMVTQKQEVARKALESLRPEIEKKVLAQKEERLFDEWLKNVRKNAKIKIIKN